MEFTKPYFIAGVLRKGLQILLDRFGIIVNDFQWVYQDDMMTVRYMMTVSRRPGVLPGGLKYATFLVETVQFYGLGGVLAEELHKMECRIRGSYWTDYIKNIRW